MHKDDVTDNVRYMHVACRHFNMKKGTVRTAWTLLNDSFVSSKVAEPGRNPVLLPASCLYIADELRMCATSRMGSPRESRLNNTKWWRSLHLTDAELDDCASWVIQITAENASPAVDAAKYNGTDTEPASEN